MTFSANSLKILLAAGLVPAGTAVAAQDRAGTVQEMYNKLCSGCHSASPAAMKGKPVDSLAAGMERVKNLSNATGAAARMQQTVQGLTPAQMKDIATYLNQMK